MLEYGCLRILEILLKRNGSLTYGITVRSRISVFVHEIQPRTLGGFNQKNGNSPRWGWIKELRISTHSLGWEIWQYDKIQTKPEKETRGIGCQVKEGWSLSAKDRCLKMGKWSLLSTPWREKKFFGMANKTQITKFANSQCKFGQWIFLHSTMVFFK